MRRIVRWSAPLVLVALASAGCIATRNWVNDNLGKRQGQIDDRFARTETTVRDVGDAARVAQSRADAAHERADAAAGRADAAAGRAEAAYGRADAAYGRADDVNARVSRLWTGRNKRNVVETMHVQFGFNRADLSDGAQTALLGIVKELKSNADLTVDLEGYTDPTGPRDYNVALSQRRVESVRRYLIENGADLARIYSVGMGPLTAAAGEHAKLRRVTVRLMINPTD
jgi:outer membrane protein OmpA-like peptidoglycan-associated protein